MILADLESYAMCVWIGGPKRDVSLHCKFDYFERAYRFTAYLDGMPWPASATTLLKGRDTQSPFITLATRS